MDRTIPFYNIIMRCDHYIPQEIVLPEGFAIVPYRTGDENAWARLEVAIGDFDSTDAAIAYFAENYLQDLARRRNILFLTNPDGQSIGSCIAWEDLRGGLPIASLHWLVVDAAYRQMGLGRALCLAAMNLFAERNAFPIYIHTQPWSWKAILLYISIGFRMQKTNTFSHYENQYARAMETLRGVVPYALFERICASAEN